MGDGPAGMTRLELTGRGQPSHKRKGEAVTFGYKKLSSRFSRIPDDISLGTLWNITGHLLWVQNYFYDIFNIYSGVTIYV